MELSLLVDMMEVLCYSNNSIMVGQVRDSEKPSVLNKKCTAGCEAVGYSPRFQGYLEHVGVKME